MRATVFSLSLIGCSGALPLTEPCSWDLYVPMEQGSGECAVTRSPAGALQAIAWTTDAGRGVLIDFDGLEPKAGQWFNTRVTGVRIGHGACDLDGVANVYEADPWRVGVSAECHDDESMSINAIARATPRLP